MELKGTSAIVTGGASGLGEATARTLANRGAHVIVADLNAEAGEALAKEIGGTFVSCDVTNTDQVIAAVDAAAAAAPLFSVVNCAGVGWATRTIGKDGEYASAHDLDLYRKVIEINLVGTFNVCRLAATKMSLNTPDEDGCRRPCGSACCCCRRAWPPVPCCWCTAQRSSAPSAVAATSGHQCPARRPRPCS